MKYRNYINGRWMPKSKAEETFESRNPANIDEVLGMFPRSKEKEVKLAVRAAKNAFDAWDSTSRIKRGELLDNLAQLIKRDLEKLAVLVSKECGKHINEGRADVVEALHMIQYAAGLARMSHGDVLESEIAEKDAYLLRRPVGVIGVITPWNFPIAIPTWLIGIPLLEGNTLVFKPASDTALCGHRLTELIHEAGFPPGVFNLVHGKGSEAGEALINHPDVDMILFTGSSDVVQRIKRVCAKSPHKECATEAGGKAGLIITANANLEMALAAAVLGAFKTTGQRCVSTSRLIVDEKVVDEFQEKFLEVVKRMKIGDPLDPNVFMGPMVNEEGVKRVIRYNEIVREAENKKRFGVEILYGKGFWTLEGTKYKKGYFLSPFVYRVNEYGSEFVPCQEEVFGPHVAIIPYLHGNIQEAIRIHNDTAYGLAGGIITEDFREARLFKKKARLGLGYWNLPTIGAEVHLPFGGLKKSGNGHPSAAGLIETVSHKTAWTENYGEEIKMAQGLSTKV